ncbi:hypothetical protein MNBD_ACTINO02-440 [hydrothermal vent metagenome]|uniref:DUF3291 domain-containing protein n=1 Tax=hydrothermal vent metagenome TaxID=652676 RepID=A0A3B0S489_9ZZZZ
MNTALWHLAQINVAQAVGVRDSPEMKAFVDLLDEVNAEADTAPGFVWRWEGAYEDTGDDAFDAETVLVNLSVWESYEALQDYVYNNLHREVFRRRREWFAFMKENHFAMWWVPAGTIPTVEESLAKLTELRENGPSPSAFNVRQRFTSTGEEIPWKS